ncbi:MAG: efflux RND transporter permease subunit [Chthoniobacterales bacterium]|nr:efflux RND transporter permease subunit [Chthoniobacterales bacterium]
MNVFTFFIRRPIATSLLTGGFFLLGITAYFFLPVAPLPNIEFPTISVTAKLPGADPKTIASSLAAPLEHHFSSIAGVDEITSLSSMGSCTIVLQFSLNEKIDDAARSVQAAINAASSELPTNMPSPPMWRKVNPNDNPIVILALTSPAYRSPELYNFAYQLLVPRLSQLAGVSQVDIGGGAKSAIRIELNPAVLASMGLTLETIRSVITSASTLMPKGSATEGNTNYTFESNDQLLTPSDYENLLVRKTPSTSVRLGNIAKVTLGNENIQATGSFNGERAVLLMIRKQADANIIKTSEEIMALLPQLRSWLPASVSLSVLNERTGTIRASLQEVQWSLLLSLVLVVLVCFLFLRNLRTTAIAAITIPLSLAGTLMVMWSLHESIDNLSLMALIVAVGFVVDDAIVVIEVITQKLENGCAPSEAALLGLREVGFTICSITISLIAAFIPIYFMGGLIGRLFHEFAIVLTAAIMTSAFVSLIFTPMVCSRFLRSGIRTEVSPYVQKIVSAYEGMLSRALHHSYFMLGVFVATLLLTGWCYWKIPKGFFPIQDTGLIIGTTEAGQDISFEAMKKKQKELVALIEKDPDVAAVGSSLGATARNTIGGSNVGKLYISLKPLALRKASSAQIISRLREASALIPGISMMLQPVQDIRVGGRPGKALYIYSLDGPNFEELTHWVPLLVQRLQAMPQLTDVSSDDAFLGLQAKIVIDRDKAASLGISMEQIDNLLYNAFGQRQISTFYTSQDEYHTILEVENQYLKDPSALEGKIFLTSKKGQQIPLSAIAHVDIGNTAIAIPHQGESPAISISFNTAPGVALSEALSLIQEADHDIHLPANIHGKFQGNAKVFSQSQQSQLLLILAALVAVYLVLGILYESLLHPLTIISTLPSAGLGALLALRYYHMDLSIVAIIGVILLIGIVKKNAILMVDCALDILKKENISAKEAITKACLSRFRPIIMTTMAALMGALPLAIVHGEGAELRQPLGITIIGGLLLSQLLTLFTTPVIFLFLERVNTKKPRGHKVR